jgi:hypothetical protein
VDGQAGAALCNTAPGSPSALAGLAAHYLAEQVERTRWQPRSQRLRSTSAAPRSSAAPRRSCGSCCRTARCSGATPTSSSRCGVLAALLCVRAAAAPAPVRAGRPAQGVCFGGGGSEVWHGNFWSAGSAYWSALQAQQQWVAACSILWRREGCLVLSCMAARLLGGSQPVALVLVHGLRLQAPAIWHRQTCCLKEICRLSPFIWRLSSLHPCSIRTRAVSWQALCAAMREPERAADPALTNEYQKLFTAASKCAEVEIPTFLPPYSPAACRPPTFQVD